MGGAPRASLGERIDTLDHVGRIPAYRGAFVIPHAFARPGAHAGYLPHQTTIALGFGRKLTLLVGQLVFHNYCPIHGKYYSGHIAMVHIRQVALLSFGTFSHAGTDL